MKTKKFPLLPKTLEERYEELLSYRKYLETFHTSISRKEGNWAWNEMYRETVAKIHIVAKELGVEEE